jgi:FKBP-type peptidyl-prolyl cis-trans isomerase SlpA
MVDLIARQGDLPIAPMTRVTLHFTLALVSGEEVDTTRHGAPATFDVGDGKLLPGFEMALIGYRAGDEVSVTLPPEQAFGEHRAANVQRMSRGKFTDVTPEPGLLVSFGAADGELPGLVTKIEGDWVSVDFNHPLAGRDVVFDVSVIRVEPAPSAARRSSGDHPSR